MLVVHIVALVFKFCQMFPETCRKFPKAIIISLAYNVINSIVRTIITEK
jgi:hypothetical protein